MLIFHSSSDIFVMVQVDGFISIPVKPRYVAFSRPNGIWLEAQRSAALLQSVCASVIFSGTGLASSARR